MTTVAISASDVNKLRQQTGAGMMDCKKALTESNGDFEAAIDYLRKKGAKVASSRSDRDAKEGMVYGKVSADNKNGVMLVLNCETDFVAMNQDFTAFGNALIDLSLANNPASIEALGELTLDGAKVSDKILDMVGKIGEKIEVSALEYIKGDRVIVYNHPGNKLTAMIALNATEGVDEIGKEVAMQLAAMAPVAIDENSVDADTIARELDVARDQARNEGKAEEMVEKIAQGRLQKFYKENTLLNQISIMDDKKTVRQTLSDVKKDLTVTSMKRIKLGN